MIAALRQGQAKPLSAHRPARRRAAQWSEYFLPSFLQTLFYSHSHQLRRNSNTLQWLQPSAKARQSAWQCLARPGGRLHSEANISFHPFYKHTFKAFFACYVVAMTHYNNCSPLPRPGEAPVGASPGPAGGCTVKRTFACILFTKTVLKADSYLWRWRGPRPLHHRGSRAPIRPGSPLVHALSSFLSIPNNGGATPTHTFVGTLCGCGFHPSNVDGWLTHNTLSADLRFWLD